MTSNGLSSRSGYRVPATFVNATREMNELFDRLFESPRTGASMERHDAPASIWEADRHYHIEIDLPGVDDGDLDVTVDDGKLLVTAKRGGDRERNYVHNERRFGELQRSITLPDTIDAESIDATYRQGVLHVALAKRPELQPRKIEVKTVS